MSPSLRILAVAAATLAAACAAALPARAASASCGAARYSYAGVLGGAAQFGVGARIAATRAPSIARGHVAGWVGVGGVGKGPGSTDEWLQVGISATPSQKLALYYELALPGRAQRYVLLEQGVRVGRSFDVAVRELPARPGFWRVWVDGAPVTPAIALPGSHGAWRPVATAESWNGGVRGTCNRFGFRFRDVKVVSEAGGDWRPLEIDRVLATAGYHLRGQPRALLAFGGS
jgi:hypothetical protein